MVRDSDRYHKAAMYRMQARYTYYGNIQYEANNTNDYFIYNYRRCPPIVLYGDHNLSSELWANMRDMVGTDMATVDSWAPPCRVKMYAGYVRAKKHLEWANADRLRAVRALATINGTFFTDSYIKVARCAIKTANQEVVDAKKLVENAKGGINKVSVELQDRI